MSVASRVDSGQYLLAIPVFELHPKLGGLPNQLLQAVDPLRHAASSKPLIARLHVQHGVRGKSCLVTTCSGLEVIEEQGRLRARAGGVLALGA